MNTRVNRRRVRRRAEVGTVAFIAVWLLMFVLNLGFWAAVIFIALHFIRKEW